MYEHLEDKYIAVINKASETTMTDYERKGNLMPIEEYKYIVEDLLTEIDKLKEEKERIIQDRNENYRQLNIAEQV